MTHVNLSASSPWRWLSNSNPFFVISSALVLLGVRLSISTQLRLEQAAVLLTITAIYTVLLVIATTLIVRLADVWQDARTALLLPPILFLSLSMLFDDLIVRQFADACLLLGIGLTFSIITSEGLMRAARIRLAPVYRSVYYGLLMMMYAYPLALGFAMKYELHAATIDLLLSLFMPIVSLVLLPLLLGIWQGPRSIEGNGTPYPFPLFPNALFVAMAGMAAWRVYLLAWAFGPGVWNHVDLAPNTFVPLVLVCGLLGMEAARVVGHRGWQQVFLLTGPAVVGLCQFSNMHYLTMRASISGPPMVPTIALCSLFYLFAWVRKVPGAGLGVVVSLIALSLEGSRFIPTLDWRAYQPEPLLLAAAFELYRAWRAKSALRVHASAAIFTWSQGSMWDIRFTETSGVVALHAFWFLLMLFSLFIAARGVRWTASIGLFVTYLCTLSVFRLPTEQAEMVQAATYVAGVTSILFVYGWASAFVPARWMALTCPLAALLTASTICLRWIRGSFLGPGIEPIAFGFAMLFLATAISLIKSPRFRLWLFDRLAERR